MARSGQVGVTQTKGSTSRVKLVISSDCQSTMVVEVSVADNCRTRSVVSAENSPCDTAATVPATISALTGPAPWNTPCPAAITSTPQKPSSTADQRCRPTFSPSRGMASMVTKSGVV
ncbi:hypothetical protein [Siccirubricoccus sp. G192]|uniref:hypothetical protein n=1 Tax=Siccirubricoccus sp. G192 TaxID=2849651 RepID=UPI0020C1FE9D|nr:hypothetical protein [Siccirubricoccus sp. G192]